MNCLANTLPIWVTMTADCCTTIDPSCDDEDDDEAMPLMVEDVELLVEWLTGAVGRAVVVANLCYAITQQVSYLSITTIVSSA